ncbi:MAG: phosphohistidine phosphatase SixA [Omnitrophica WOR_2 bacterium GWA2_47_8]|nr:MAG: phosphohistidine phosphatase SixA [Omnitrophica WOR_2 bacterium GWA2_47_8]
MKLYLIRHGDAVSDSVDPKRPLSEEGRSAVTRLGQELKSKGVRVSRIYHSQKTRAAQTAQIVRDIIDPSLGLLEREYLAPDDPLDKMLDELKKQEDDWMIVGHLPYLPALAALLVAGSVRKSVLAMPTSCAACLEKGKNNAWHISWIVRPK